MSEIKSRLQEATTACLKDYETWDGAKNSDNREKLQEAIHDLRKVASRLEIEIAISERDSMSDKPLPIPPHRSNSKGKGSVESILPDNGNTEAKPSNDKKEGGARRGRSRRPAKKAD